MSEALEWAVKNGDLGEVESLFEKQPFDVNAIYSSRTLLHHAADYGQCEVINFLLGKGADVNARDTAGITPLLAAIYEGNTDCVRLLLSKGAEKSGKGPDGMSYVEAADSDEIKQLLA